jgi:glutathione synthase/RimK-type ligase-like ATP-grasp enzyme
VEKSLPTPQLAATPSPSGTTRGRPAPLAIYYEHPVWFERLFAELDRRGTPYVKVDAASHVYDPAELAADRRFPVVFNRMSPSAYRRSHAQVFYTLHYLAGLELAGKRVINGAKAFRHETSKALQLSLLISLGLPAPRTRVIHDPLHAVAAAAGLRYPIVVKPNVGGSGAGVTRYDSPAALAGAVSAGTIDLGLDHVALVQEFMPAREGHITRIEVVGGRYLYAIKVFLSGETFDLCPADICKTASGVELAGTCAVEAPKAGLRVEGCTPPPDVVVAAERVMQQAGIDVGGIEYVIDDRDGQLYFYDVNALSNFVADGRRVVGFDPFLPLADYLEAEMEAHHAS